VVKAYHAHVGTGESVNCHKKRKADNDVHIALEEAPGADLCERIIAEISPHFRPASWARHVVQSLRRHPVRLTGQLFFDAGHKPCSPSQRRFPARISVWEIHPVYGIDVCKKRSLSRCRADQNSKWIPLHEWLQGAESGK